MTQAVELRATPLFGGMTELAKRMNKLAQKALLNWRTGDVIQLEKESHLPKDTLRHIAQGKAPAGFRTYRLLGLRVHDALILDPSKLSPEVRAYWQDQMTHCPLVGSLAKKDNGDALREYLELRAVEELADARAEAMLV